MRLIIFWSFFLLLFSFTAQARVHDGVLLIIDDPKLLEALEAKGFSAPEMIEGIKESDNGSWSKKPYYKSIAKTLSEDLDRVQSKDPRLGPSMRKVHRLFDKGWLTSSEARFELVGVVNRLDRASFYQTGHPGHCGEVRFIYRLSYHRTKDKIYTRMPVTFNVVYWAPEQKCQQTAKDWLFTKEPTHNDLAKVLKGPLQKEKFALSRQKSVEVNLQSVRWPSTIRADLGGHAEYILRVFIRGSEKFEPSSLENMPDIQAIRKDPSLLKSFKEQIIKSQNKFDEGTETLPEKFLAKSATSVAFYGQARLANRPFDQLVKEEDLKALVYDNAEFVKSPRGYLRRLNDMSCVGCHQSRSIAGFHFVGIDGEKTLTENAIKVSHSAHLVRDLPRRSAFVKAVAKSQEPDPERALSERAKEGEGTYGDHCGLSQDPTFKSWNCKTGFECKAEVTAKGIPTDVGVCMEKEILSGDPCDVGTITQEEDPHKDRMVQKKVIACPGGRYCLRAGDGFPAGICFGECDTLAKGEACGLIAVGGFNQCLAKGDLFTNCLRENTSPISMRGCDESTPCRDDFICTVAKNGKGACIPPYFLFQLRLDGHVKP